MKTARVIITFDCKRNCDGCCNTYTSVMQQAKWIDSIKPLREFDEICVTGGEPMLNPDKTIKFLLILMSESCTDQVYLYTALYSPHIVRTWGLIKGIHYTIHYPAKRKDLWGFWKMQRILRKRLKKTGKLDSNRLYIDPRVTQKITVQYHLWKEVRNNPWIPEGKCPLPEHETLFIYTGK